jgi:hypothetical protein
MAPCLVWSGDRSASGRCWVGCSVASCCLTRRSRATYHRLSCLIAYRLFRLIRCFTASDVVPRWAAAVGISTHPVWPSSGRRSVMLSPHCPAQMTRNRFHAPPPLTLRAVAPARHCGKHKALPSGKALTLTDWKHRKTSRLSPFVKVLAGTSDLMFLYYRSNMSIENGCVQYVYGVMISA